MSIFSIFSNDWLYIAAPLSNFSANTIRCLQKDGYSGLALAVPHHHYCSIFDLDGRVVNQWSASRHCSPCPEGMFNMVVVVSAFQS